MRLSDVEHTFEWAGILFRELTLCCLPDEQFTQDMDSLMAAAQRVLTIVQKATGLPRNKSIEITLEIMQNKIRRKRSSEKMSKCSRLDSYAKYEYNIIGHRREVSNAKNYACISGRPDDIRAV